MCLSRSPGLLNRRPSFLHFITNWSPKLHRGSRGPLRPGVAFPTTSSLRCLWSLTVWLPVLTELYNSSTPTQSPTQSLEWHVWSSSSENNCHAVQRSLSSGESVYDCIMGYYLVPFHQPNPPTRFLSITGHWDVSLPFGASLWNGMFGRAEGQYITVCVYACVCVFLHVYTCVHMWPSGYVYNIVINPLTSYLTHNQS